MLKADRTLVDHKTSMSGSTHALQRCFTGRTMPFGLAAIAFAGGLALNWNWLVAVGAAPLPLSALPYVAMCVLGLCMSRAGSRSQPTGAPSSEVSRGDNT